MAEHCADLPTTVACYANTATRLIGRQPYILFVKQVFIQSWQTWQQPSMPRTAVVPFVSSPRSEERRVGKDGRSRGCPGRYTKVRNRVCEHGEIADYDRST